MSDIPASDSAASPAAAPASAASAASAASPTGLPADGATLLTQQDAAPGTPPADAPGTSPDKGQPPADDKPADPAAVVPESPDGYALEFAEGTVLDEVLLGSFKTTAHELGISQGQAQKLADLYAGHVAAKADAMQQEQAAALRTAVDGWEQTIKSSPTFAADKEHAQRALVQYGNPELFQVIDDTLIGSHPAMFSFMAAVGKALAEPVTRGNGASGPLDAAKILYPNLS